MKIFTHNETLSVPSAVCLGNFDGVHKGHAALLSRTVEEARARGLFSLAYTFDAHPENVMAGSIVTPLITDNAEKAALFAGLSLDGAYFAHFTDALCSLSPERFVTDVLQNTLHASLCLCGFHYHFGARGEGDVHLLRTLCEKAGITLIVLPPVTACGVTVSSSLVRSMIASGKMEGANELLGHPFTLTAVVEEGKQLGRTLGLPTINQRFSEDRVLPRFGVYESRTIVSGREYRSLTNVGMRPTVKGEQLNAETHIRGFSGDLYGEMIEVHFLRFVRPERKFESVTALKEQIERDLLATFGS